jgi:hypothetical protein
MGGHRDRDRSSRDTPEHRGRIDRQRSGVVRFRHLRLSGPCHRSILFPLRQSDGLSPVGLRRLRGRLCCAAGRRAAVRLAGRQIRAQTGADLRGDGDGRLDILCRPVADIRAGGSLGAFSPDRDQDRARPVYGRRVPRRDGFSDRTRPCRQAELLCLVGAVRFVFRNSARFRCRRAGEQRFRPGRHACLGVARAIPGKRGDCDYRHLPAPEYRRNARDAKPEGPAGTGLRLSPFGRTGSP